LSTLSAGSAQENRLFDPSSRLLLVGVRKGICDFVDIPSLATRSLSTLSVACARAKKPFAVVLLYINHSIFDMNVPEFLFARARVSDIVDKRSTGKTPGVDALFSCIGSGKPNPSYV
jgi:hypothetical protein